MKKRSKVLTRKKRKTTRLHKRGRSSVTVENDDLRSISISLRENETPKSTTILDAVRLVASLRNAGNDADADRVSDQIRKEIRLAAPIAWYSGAEKNLAALTEFAQRDDKGELLLFKQIRELREAKKYSEAAQIAEPISRIGKTSDGEGWRRMMRMVLSGQQVDAGDLESKLHDAALFNDAPPPAMFFFLANVIAGRVKLKPRSKRVKKAAATRRDLDLVLRFELVRHMPGGREFELGLLAQEHNLGRKSKEGGSSRGRGSAEKMLTRAKKGLEPLLGKEALMLRRPKSATKDKT